MKVKTYVPNMYSTYRIYQSIALQIAEMKSAKRHVLPDMKTAGTFFVFRDAPAVDNNQADILLNLNHNELKFLYERILQLPKQVRSPTLAGTCSRCIVGKNARAQSSGRFRPFPSCGR